MISPILTVVSGGLETAPYFCWLFPRDIEELVAMSDEKRMLDPRSAHVKRCTICLNDQNEQLAMKAARSIKAV